MNGVNVDLRNPVGRPDPGALRGFRFVRLPYNVSGGTGSLDYNAAAQLYVPFVNSLRGIGAQAILVAGHQLWGEGRGFNWEHMTEADWARLIDGYCAALRIAAQGVAGQGVIWQIWNEQDAASVAAVGVPPAVYGALYTRARQVVAGVDPTARVIMGGLVSGPGSGIAYLRATGLDAAALPGAGAHLYGVGAGGLYNQFGTIESQLAQWRAAFPRLPLYITEWGVLDRPAERVEDVAAYARAFMAACSGNVAAACWYAWADGMHNGYGVATVSGQVKAALLAALTAGGGTPAPQPESPGTRYPEVTGLRNVLNVRDAPTTAAAIIGKLSNGARLLPLPEVDGDWAAVELPGGRRGWAHRTAAGVLSVKL